MNYLVTLQIKGNEYAFHIFGNYLKARRYMNKFNFKHQNIREIHNMEKTINNIFSDYSDIPYTIYQDENLFIVSNKH